MRKCCRGGVRAVSAGGGLWDPPSSQWLISFCPEIWGPGAVMWFRGTILHCSAPFGNGEMGSGCVLGASPAQPAGE